jgi:hypothetical protein
MFFLHYGRTVGSVWRSGINMKPSTYNSFALVLSSKNLSFPFGIPVQKDLIDLLTDTTCKSMW